MYLMFPPALEGSCWLPVSTGRYLCCEWHRSCDSWVWPSIGCPNQRTIKTPCTRKSWISPLDSGMFSVEGALRPKQRTHASAVASRGFRSTASFTALHQC